MFLGARSFTVDGLYHRDHSSGPRDWSQIVAHRWVAGTFGPDLSFSVAVIEGPGGHGLQAAATDVDLDVHFAEDGRTGFADVEVSNRPRPWGRLTKAATQPGLSRR